MQAPPGKHTRPMMDRVKEALFSTIGSTVVDAEVLDLYAGSGALGIESISRGAASATFVENNRTALQALVGNLDRVGFDGTVERSEVLAFLAGTTGRFSLIFIDPPYELSLALVNEVLEGAAAHLANGGLMVLHRRAGEAAPTAPDGTVCTDDRRYGDSRLWLYRRNEP